jgi:HD-like signal output (HDOD) protein
MKNAELALTVNGDPLFKIDPALAKASLLGKITRALKAGTLELPSLPDIALEVRLVVTERDMSMTSLAKVVQQDPGLSAYLIKVSNSVHYGRGNAAASLPAALNRLGVAAIRNLASSYAIKTLFYLKEPAIKVRLREVWSRSVYTAAFARVMAVRCGFNPDQAMLAGLLQDIGALPILSELRQYPVLLGDGAAIELLLAEFTGKVSGMILNHWQFPHELVVTGLAREQWQRGTHERADLADLVLIARHHTYLGEPAARKLPALKDLPAFHRLRLDESGPEQGLLFLREAREEVESLRKMLLS